LTFAPWNYYSNKIDVKVKDNVAGTEGSISSFSAVYMGITSVSTNIPTAVPDNNGQFGSASIILVPEPCSAICFILLAAFFRPRPQNMLF